MDTIKILHLSDLHFYSERDAQKYFVPLKEDLIDNDIKRLDYLVISGDIGNKSLEEEYAAALSFIDRLKNQFELNESRIVIVPGNHDLNWDITKKAYEFVWIDPNKLATEVDENIRIRLRKEGKFIHGGEFGYLCPDDDKYKKKFEKFSNHFYEKITGKTYNENFEKQIIFRKYDDDEILFLCINSSILIDHHYRDRMGMNLEIIYEELASESEKKGLDNYKLKIVVMHHPVYEEMKKKGILDRLGRYDFRLLMHGHLHETKKEVFKYDENSQLTIIAAGCFGRATRSIQQTPMQYQWLKYDPSKKKIYVNTRKRNELTKQWEPDAIWGNQLCPKPYYLISFGVRDLSQTMEQGPMTPSNEFDSTLNKLPFDDYAIKLKNRTWPEIPEEKIDIDNLHNTLFLLAFKAHENMLHNPKEQEGGTVTQKKVLQYFSLNFNNNPKNTQSFVDYIITDIGILKWRSEAKDYIFSSYDQQQYLAAHFFITENYDDFKIMALILKDSEKWETVFIEYIKLFFEKKGLSLTISLLMKLYDNILINLRSDRQRQLINLIGKTLLGVGIDALKRKEQGKKTLKLIQKKLNDFLRSGDLNIVEQIELQDTIFGIRDHRFDPMNFYLSNEENNGYLYFFLNDGLKKTISDTYFVLNQSKPKQTYEFDQHIAISKYLVTKDQFKAFINDSGYHYDHCESETGNGSHPITRISWKDAVAYCEWLTQKIGGSDWKYRLPSLKEWKKAGGGINGRASYPWGDTIEKNKLNFDGTGIGKTTPVGCFPDGKSPIGCLDMAGNVWEWMLDSSDSNDQTRIVCGGAYDCESEECQLNFYDTVKEYEADDNRGFRLVKVKLNRK